jgi:hypothetical protein
MVILDRGAAYTDGIRFLFWCRYIVWRVSFGEAVVTTRSPDVVVCFV